MHESGRDSAQISRETQKSGSQSDLQRLRGKKVEGRLKPAEADRALDGYSLSSDAGLAAPPDGGKNCLLPCSEGEDLLHKNKPQF